MYPPGGPGMFGPPPSPQPPQLTPEVTFLYIPEKSVGAVIGSKGTNIKNIMRLSKARIKVSGGMLNYCSLAGLDWKDFLG